MANIPPHMPEVDPDRDIAQCFAMLPQLVRPQGKGDHPDQRCVVLITPGRLMMSLKCPPPGSMQGSMVETVERLVPATPPKQVRVIAFTNVFALVKPGENPATPANVAKLIPFVGYVIGLGYIGHTVAIFEGHPWALEVGCRDVDVLVVDEAMVPHLQRDWAQVAFRVMRGPAPTVLIFGRNGSVSQLKKSAIN